METNDSNLKPQATGGLKLMTVFIAVLALHVVVIGGFTVYHLMSGGTTDADLTLDKNHKGLKIAPDGSVVADSTLPDTTLGDKTSVTSTPPPTAEVASVPANPATSASDQTVPTDVTTLTPAPTPGISPTPTMTPMPATTTASMSPAPAPASTPAVTTMTPSTPTGGLNQAVTGTTTPATATPIVTPAPIRPEMATTSPTLAPPPEPTAAPEPSAPPTFVGPVKMPPTASEVTAPAPVHHQTYTVKITDSYKKIAHAHHITVAQLKEANNIKGNVLHTGQKLIIPEFNREVATTASTTSLDSAPTGPVFDTPAPASTAILASSSTSTVVPMSLHHHVYTVVKGDTLTKIAHRFKTTTTALMEANSITDPTKLSIGKKLKIPSQESRSAKNSEPAADRPSQVQAKSNATTAQLANFVP